MWFKNCLFYKLSANIDWQEETLNKQLAEHVFTPCGKREPSQYGWVSPLGPDHESLSHWANGCIMICARKEEKILPSTVVKDKLNEKVQLIEAREDRKIYRKEKETLKEEIVHDCLPQAFTRSSRSFAYIDIKNNWLCVDASSHGKAELLINQLRESIGSLPLILPQVIESPAVIMSEWIRGNGQPEDLIVGRECEMRETGEDGSILRCKNQDLDSEEITQHLDSGKQVVKLALNWQDSIELLLSDDLSIKRIKFSDDLVTEAEDASDGDPLLRFDADFTLLTAQFGLLLPAILEWFGGQRPDPI